MSIPRFHNLAPAAVAILQRNTHLCMQGDSFTPSERSASNQGWASWFQGFLAQLQPDVWRRITAAPKRDFAQANLSRYPFTTTHNEPSASNNPNDIWPNGEQHINAATGVAFTGHNGAGNSAYFITTLKESVWPHTDGQPIRFYVGYFRHADGVEQWRLKVQRPGIVGQFAVGPELNSYSATRDVQVATLDLPAVAAGSTDPLLFGEAPAVYASQLDHYLYTLQCGFEVQGVEGLHLSSLGVGGQTLSDLAFSPDAGDTVDGGSNYEASADWTNEALKHTIQAMGEPVDVFFHVIGTNDRAALNAGSLTNAQYRAQLVTAIKRHDEANAAAGATTAARHVICVPYTTGVDNSILEQAMWDGYQDLLAIGKPVSFISIHAILGRQPLGTQYQHDGNNIHVNQDGADYMGQLVQAELAAALTSSTKFGLGVPATEGLAISSLGLAV